MLAGFMILKRVDSIIIKSKMDRFQALGSYGRGSKREQSVFYDALKIAFKFLTYLKKTVPT
jgi:hypothetical protein